LKAPWRRSLLNWLQKIAKKHVCPVRQSKDAGIKFSSPFRVVIWEGEGTGEKRRTACRSRGASRCAGCSERCSLCVGSLFMLREGNQGKGSLFLFLLARTQCTVLYKVPSHCPLPPIFHAVRDYYSGCSVDCTHNLQREGESAMEQKNCSQGLLLSLLLSKYD
jgi:hypothetical protein